MDDRAQRIAELPPARRQLVRRLLEQDSAAPDLEPYERQLGYDPGAALGTVKRHTRQFYDSVSRQLDALELGGHAYFLNFGYVPDGSPEHAQVSLPPHALNKTCVKLVLELVGDTDLRGRRVLDIGCGRGGTVSVVRKYADPMLIVGVDLSRDAIAFCRRVHAGAGVRFYEGDAEHLEFADATFDVVTNVESSHSYPDVSSFYREVHRLLVPAGAFLYTDLFAAARYRAQIAQLTGLGFAIESERDITRNVLLSCDESAQTHRGAFQAGPGDPGFDSFLGMPGSQVYQEMADGRSTYRMLRLRKRAP